MTGRGAKATGVRKFPEHKSKGRAKDHAARATSRDLCAVDKAEYVMDHGTLDLVRAMDDELISVDKAAWIAAGTPEFQDAVVANLAAGMKATEAVRKARISDLTPKNASSISGTAHHAKKKTRFQPRLLWPTQRKQSQSVSGYSAL